MPHRSALAAHVPRSWPQKITECAVATADQFRDCTIATALQIAHIVTSSAGIEATLCVHFLVPMRIDVVFVGEGALRAVIVEARIRKLVYYQAWCIVTLMQSDSKLGVL